MSAFSLFHQPTFPMKLQNIDSQVLMAALLASMLSFSARFVDLKSRTISGKQSAQGNARSLPLERQKHFEKLASLYVEDALDEYSDECPPLCLLQALAVLTFQQLVKGVRGTSWRRLGLCIRVAHELNLHHVDRYNTPEQTEPGVWSDIEERRRLWWAIWEMDVFASTTKRWHVISKFRSSRPGNGRYCPPRSSITDSEGTKSETLVILANALSYYAIALPAELQYRGEYLNFSSPEPGLGLETRRSQIGKYSIHVAAQLARLMIYHEDTAKGAEVDLRLPEPSQTNSRKHVITSDSSRAALRLGPSRNGLQQYHQAANELLNLISKSSRDHVRYVNPFHAGAAWHGAAFWLTWKIFAPPSTNYDLVVSKYEIMRMTLNNFAKFWELPDALLENLNSMEGKIIKFVTPSDRQATQSSFNPGTNPSERGNSYRGTVESSSTGFDDSDIVLSSRETVSDGSEGVMPPSSRQTRINFSDSRRYQSNVTTSRDLDIEGSSNPENSIPTNNGGNYENGIDHQ
ncbi:hypothetical protein DL98DRAFT_625695 [Cadophora sp. DSE1049]|nr:hypothetical protein DL98DRAFT_625695 [Cadophora sp. DSE1049]